MGWFDKKKKAQDSKNESGVKAEFITQDKSSEFLCDHYKLNGDMSAADIADFVRSKRTEHPGHTLFATLDWFGQAAYTSMHAKGKHDLDNPDGYDLSGVDAAAFEDGEHIGYLTTKSEFFIQQGNFQKGVEAHGDSGYTKMTWEPGNEEHTVLQVNADPGLIRETESYVQIVPVETGCDALCAFPNGYFTCDLSPYENYALAKDLSEKFGFELFGNGAAYLGFLRDKPLSPAEADALSAFVMALYQERENTELKASFAEAMTGRVLLFLRYAD